ncbi:hypothetical protein C8R44DRAFT_846941 [Mycena epipterygia]|nr:hypothetical protein C8R44DRAFT_846941 [Mycena epipterygia]
MHSLCFNSCRFLPLLPPSLLAFVATEPLGQSLSKEEGVRMLPACPGSLRRAGTAIASAPLHARWAHKEILTLHRRRLALFSYYKISDVQSGRLRVPRVQEPRHLCSKGAVESSARVCEEMEMQKSKVRNKGGVL